MRSGIGFGGVIGLNRELDEETACEAARLFVEAIVAPSFSEAALEVLRPKRISAWSGGPAEEACT